MDKEIDEEIINEEANDFDIDKLLSEDEDTPTEEVTEEIATEAKKNRGRPKGSTKVKPKIKTETKTKVPVEIANVNKELSDMEWQLFSQQAYDGFQNIKTGEMIDEREALRRTLCYAQEAARNSR